MLPTVLKLMPVLAASLIAGCIGQQTEAGPDAIEPAVLMNDSAETRAALKAGLAENVGRQSFEFGVGPLVGSSQITVLPPPPGPYETNSPAMPKTYDLLISGETCFARRQGEDDLIPLVDVTCKPA